MNQPVATYWFRLLGGLAVLSAAAVPVFAGTAETSHSVAVVVVPPELSFKSGSESVSLTFDGRKTTGVGEAEYQLASNTVPAVEGSIVTAQADPGTDLILEADIGSFTNDGTDGNAVLREAYAGFRQIGPETIPVGTKPESAGRQAGVLNGTLPVRWKAHAKAPPRGKQVLFVTVTLKDL